MKRIIGYFIYIITIPYRITWWIITRGLGIRVAGNTMGMLDYLQKPGDKYKKQQEFSRWLESCYYPIFYNFFDYRVCPICGTRYGGDNPERDEHGDVIYGGNSGKSCHRCGTTLSYDVDTRLFKIYGFDAHDTPLESRHEQMQEYIEHYKPTMYEGGYGDDNTITININY